ncbi:MAG: hypothetical protein KF683_18100 [Rubrivivax sp.]|nr:hypothetical protein [Rubrivivax sp.]
MSPPTPPPSLPAWPLPLVAGLLPAVATLLALALSTRAELIPACNPFIDGCVSISRAARHDLPNHLFRALVLPAAALQALTWVLMVPWLRGLGDGGRGLRWLLPLGLLAGVALALYGSFLGTEGAVYRLLRQYGTVVYFGFTCINMLIAGGAIARAAGAGRLAVPRGLHHALVALGGALVLLGLGNAVLSALFDDPLKDQVQNVTEWWGGAIFVAVFLALAAIWRRCGLRLQLASAGTR